MMDPATPPPRLRTAFATSLAILLAAALPAGAQDRDGNDTAGDWRTDHFQSFGPWDSACDWRDTAGTRTRRCYVRYVDVISPAPAFAAVFAFLEPDPAGYRLSVGIEPGTTFRDDGFRIDWDGATRWSFAGDLCLKGGTCTWTGARSDPPFSALAAPATVDGSLVLVFSDRHGQSHTREWDLAPIRAALDDMDRQAAQRGLR